MRTFGPGAAFDGLALRYPRERLFHALPLLLWEPGKFREPDVNARLQNQLRTAAREWTGFVSAYKQIWPLYS